MHPDRTAVSDRFHSTHSRVSSPSTGRRFAGGFWLTALMLLACSILAQPARALPTDTATQASSAARDGQHDFDFNLGAWRTHIRRIQDPLSGGTHVVELNGTVRVRKVWSGRAQLEEIEADGPNGHWEGLTMFLYNPRSHQWGQWFINSKMATLSTPLRGAFKSGRGQLFSQDTYEGRSILVRGTWSDITPDAHHYEESYSTDGGQTWSPAFLADLTRDPLPKPDVAADSADHSAASSHAFDFDFGQWKTDSSRLLHPLTGSTDWIDLHGATMVTKIWGGRANLAEYKAKGPTGELELLALRWYNPATGQWSIDFATPQAGAFGVPSVGEFKNGRGDFYDYEEIDGRFVMVRFSMWGITPETAQSEQAFSTDGGKTWEVNWINRYSRDANDQ